MESESFKTILQGANLLQHIIPNFTFEMSKRSIKARPFPKLRLKAEDVAIIAKGLSAGGTTLAHGDTTFSGD